jgi:hypothetical protein
MHGNIHSIKHGGAEHKYYIQYAVRVPISNNSCNSDLTAVMAGVEEMEAMMKNMLGLENGETVAQAVKGSLGLKMIRR